MRSYLEARENCSEKYYLEDINLIGRNPRKSNVRMKSLSVSRVHARISCVAGKWFICDLHSRNGTFLNGRRLEPDRETELEDGDTVRFGNKEFVFHRAPVASGSPASPYMAPPTVPYMTPPAAQYGTGAQLSAPASAPAPNFAPNPTPAPPPAAAKSGFAGFPGIPAGFPGTPAPGEKRGGGSVRFCPSCGSRIDRSDMRFCPHCGRYLESSGGPGPAAEISLSKVAFSAVAPKTLVRGGYSMIHVIVYEESCRYVVDELIRTMDEPAQEARGGVQKVREGAAIKIVLASPDISIEDNLETGVWCGEHLDFSFAVLLPDDFPKGQLLFIASVYIDDVIATRLKFIVKCSSPQEQRIAVSRDDVLSAFISYASQDRNRVAAIVQGMKKARPDLDVFFDVDSLRSGDDWEQALHKEIDRRDVLFLCWSHFARESKWVDAEWRYALAQKGEDCIEPVPIEPPDICPPPEELHRKHFNDRMLYIINAHQQGIGSGPL